MCNPIIKKWHTCHVCKMAVADMSYVVSTWVKLTTFSVKYLQGVKENQVTLSSSFFFGVL